MRKLLLTLLFAGAFALLSGAELRTFIFPVQEEKVPEKKKKTEPAKPAKNKKNAKRKKPSSPASIWDMTPKQIQSKFRKLLVASGKNRLCASPKTIKSFKFDNSAIHELEFNFSDGKLSGIHIAIYTRGDAGKKLLPEKDFEKLCETTADKIAGSYLPGVRGKKLPRAKLHGNRIESRFFAGKSCSVQLSSGSSEEKGPEFLTLDILPPGSEPRKFKDSMRTKISSASLAERVQQSDGERFILLPMIDQGAKGYCAPASINRILLYYGSGIELHALAGMLGADPVRGTSVNEMVTLLKKIDSKIGVRYQELYEFDGFEPRRVRIFVKRYNAIARKRKAALLDLSNPGSAMAFDKDVFAEIRSKEVTRRERFFEQVRSHIDRGIPMGWGVLIFPAKKGGRTTGHLRLITGYNAESREIIYSDTWGKGHDKKSESLDDAWTRTTTVFVLNPPL